MSGIPWRVLPPGPRPFDHRRDFPDKPGQVRVIDQLDVRVRRGSLYTDGGLAFSDGHDDLQVLGRTGLVLTDLVVGSAALVSTGLVLGAVRTLPPLVGLVLGFFLSGDRRSKRYLPSL